MSVRLVSWLVRASLPILRRLVALLSDGIRTPADASGLVDRKVTSVMTDAPATGTAGIAFTLLVDSVVHNNGPTSPSSASVTVTLNLLLDCSAPPISPLGPYSLAVSVAQAIPTQPFSVTCSDPSFHTLRPPSGTIGGNSEGVRR